MTELSYFPAFIDELEKISSAGSIGRRLLGSASRGAITGGLTGLAAGAMSGDPESSAADRVERAVRGGLVGAATGGLAGSVARRAADYKLLHPGAGARDVATGTARSLGGSVKRFAQRQAHGLTGAYGDDVGRIGMEGRTQAARDIHLAGLRRDELLREARTSGERRMIHARHGQEVAKHVSSAAQGEDAAKHGLTSLPGIVKGLATRPKDTARAMWRHTTGGGGSRAAGLIIAANALPAIPSLMRGDESREGGPTMKRKLLMTGTNLAGGVATAGLPVVPQMLASEALNRPVAHRQRSPRGTVVRDVHSLERQQERDDVR